MPRKTKNKPTVRKTKNKQKVVVRNVININSNNKRKGITKPSFAQMAQPRTASTVVSHYVQNPNSAYNPQGESSLVKSMEIMNNLINKYAEREGKLYGENLDRLRASVGGAKGDKPLQDASRRQLNFDLPSPSSSTSSGEGKREIVEKGGGGLFSSLTPFRNRSFSTSFGGSNRGATLDEILRGNRNTEGGTPQANSLGLQTPQTALRGNEGVLKEDLEQLSKADLRALFKNVTKAPAPPASKEADIINKLLNEFRDETGRMLVQSTAKKGGSKK